MNEQELKELSEQMKAHVKQGIEASELKSLEAINALKKENAELESKISLLNTKKEEITKEVVKAQEQIAAMKENATAKEMNVALKVLKVIQDKKDEIKAAIKSGNKNFELVLHSVAGTTSTASVSAPDALPAILGTQVAETPNAELRDYYIENVVTNIPTSMRVYVYNEFEPKDGNFAAVAEGGIKPLKDFTIKTRYAEPKKAAAKVRLTEEIVEDVLRMQALVTDFLYQDFHLTKQYLCLFGNSTTPEQPDGMYTIATAFDGSVAPFAGSVDKPNFMDVVHAMATKIATSHNYNREKAYKANLVLVNEIDYFINVTSAKTQDGVPLYPNAGEDGFTVGNLTVRTESDIPSGMILVCDGKKYNVSNYVPYNVRIAFGVVSDGDGGFVSDAEKNQFLLIGEGRFHAFTKNLDKVAFLKGEIDTIKGNLTKGI